MLRLVLLGNLFIGCLVLVAEDGSQNGARRGVYQRRFENPSILASKASLDERLKPPSNFYSGELDIGKEDFDIYVPDDYQPGKPFGLFVWINSGDCGLTPNEWYPTFNKYHIICIGGAKTGKDRSRADRIRIALAAYQNMKSLYTLDDERIYIAGFAGGAKVAADLGLAFGDVFRGGVYICGAAPYKAATPAAQAAYEAARARNRYVFITGESDATYRKEVIDTYKSGYERAGFKYCSLLDQPGMGHVNPNPEFFDKAVTFLEKPIIEQVKADLQHAAALTKGKKYSEAMRLYQKILTRGTEATALQDARVQLDALNQSLRDKTAEAQKLVDANENTKALTLLKEIIASFGDEATEAKAMLQKIQGGSEAKRR
jgi:hypothetical protein